MGIATTAAKRFMIAIAMKTGQFLGIHPNRQGQLADNVATGSCAIGSESCAGADCLISAARGVAVKVSAHSEPTSYQGTAAQRRREVLLGCCSWYAKKPSPLTRNCLWALLAPVPSQCIETV